MLEEALKRSDELVKLEKRAFAAFEGLYDDGAGNFTVPGNPTGSVQSSYCSAASTWARKRRLSNPCNDLWIYLADGCGLRPTSGLARLEQQIMTEMILIFIALLATMGIIFYTRPGYPQASG